jgi:hypothetical protein
VAVGRRPVAGRGSCCWLLGAYAACCLRFRTRPAARQQSAGAGSVRRRRRRRLRTTSLSLVTGGAYAKRAMRSKDPRAQCQPRATRC